MSMPASPGAAPSAPASNAPPSASNAPAPASGGVPIDTNPVSSPAPIGSQTPPARQDRGPAEKPASAQGRREAIRNAFAKAGSKAPEGKGAEAEPERTLPKIDLRKRPDEGVNKQRKRGDRPRGEHGHFAPGQVSQSGQPSQPGQMTQLGQQGGQQRGQQGGQQGGQQVARYDPASNPLPAQSPFREPPARMAEHAKTEWHAAPESVRGEVHRMHREFAAAHQQHQETQRRHQAANNALAPVAPYYKMAHEHGTTLAKALSNYVGIEQKLRADPIGGLDVIVSNLNLRTPEGRKLGLRDVAQYVLSRTPEQLQMTQHANSQTAVQQQLADIAKQQAALAQAHRQMQYQQQFAQTRGAVDRFAETHPRLDELGPLIERELKFGFDLETAYRRAELLKPATHAAQTRTPSAQTRRNTDRSISGAPAQGVSSPDAQRRRGKAPSRREAIASAMRRANGSL